MDISKHQMSMITLVITSLSCMCVVNCLLGEEISIQSKVHSGSDEQFDENDPTKPHMLFGIDGLEKFTWKQLDSIKTTLLNSLSPEHEIVQSTLAMSLDQVIVMVAARAGWKKRCHMHTSDANMVVIEGSFYFKLHNSKDNYVVNTGNRFLVPKFHPHSEGTHGEGPVVIIVKWVPIPKDKAKMTVFLSEKLCDNRYFPNNVLPTLDTDVKPAKTILPDSWAATAIVQPFRPPKAGEKPQNPFFQVAKVKLSYSFSKKIFVIWVKGCDYGTWWYIMKNNKTFVEKGGKWIRVDMGWTFPSRDWLGHDATFSGRSTLNWMNGNKKMDWWKKPYKQTSSLFWFDSNKSGVPFRMMFGLPPVDSTKGDPKNLAFFQMFAMTYIVNFENRFVDMEENFFQGNDDFDNTGLECGNPGVYTVSNWPSHFSMSAFTVSAYQNINPLPTHIYYRWRYGDWNGTIYDRMQKVDYYYQYCPKYAGLVSTTAMFGEWANTKHKQDGYALTSNIKTWKRTCARMLADGVPMGQLPPSWPKLADGKIMAVIRKPVNASSDWISPYTGSNRTIAILGMKYATDLRHHTKLTYMWTWHDYSEYLTSTSKPARPVSLYMVGANVDYFDYHQIEDDVVIPMSYLESSMAGICKKGYDAERTIQGSSTLRPETFFPLFN